MTEKEFFFYFLFFFRSVITHDPLLDLSAVSWVWEYSWSDKLLSVPMPSLNVSAAFYMINHKTPLSIVMSLRGVLEACILLGGTVISGDMKRIHICFMQTIHCCLSSLSPWSSSILPLYLLSYWDNIPHMYMCFHASATLWWRTTNHLLSFCRCSCFAWNTASLAYIWSQMATHYLKINPRT